MSMPFIQLTKQLHHANVRSNGESPYMGKEIDMLIIRADMFYESFSRSWIPVQTKDGDTVDSLTKEFSDFLDSGMAVGEECYALNSELVKRYSTNIISSDEWLSLSNENNSRLNNSYVFRGLNLEDIRIASVDESLSDWQVMTVDDMLEVMKTERKPK